MSKSPGHFQGTTTPAGHAIGNPVGVFDSGVGGLSVLQALLAQLPHEHFVFVADEAHLPYGDKSQSFLQERVLAVAQYIHNLPAKALVLACNTATAAAVDAVRSNKPGWPVVGIEPALKPAIAHSKTGVVGLLATTHTLASARFQNLLALCPAALRIVPVPCPGLVELIEAETFDRLAVLELLQPIVSHVVQQGADVLVLGCTHYPFVRDCIAEALAATGHASHQAMRVLEPSEPVARQTQVRLQQAGLAAPIMASAAQWPVLNRQEDLGRVQFFTTGNPQLFAKKLVRLMGSQWQAAQVNVLPTTLF